MVKKPKFNQKTHTGRDESSGYQPRGSKRAARKLARASGFHSATEITELFPPGMRRPATILQQALAEIVNEATPKDLENSAISFHYASLIHALTGTEKSSDDNVPVTRDENTSDPAEHRARKQSTLATDALRQVLLEAVETPLSMLPSLLADNSLSDQEKLKSLAVYTRSLEMLYEPLQLEPIGDPGEKVPFDPRMHESAKELTAGDHCVIKRIGFTKGDSVVRKAVVETKE